ncbi:hypothetical protein ACFWOJ_21740 [Streptomyces sp. NPDC058439]|uniref:hypothetical protein n=1 Tax=Streptomyces sp. NPDC058439 TaxID=3346500 RepID=UPI0036566EC8
MNEFKFELKPFTTKQEVGHKGTVGPFGEVTVAYMRKKWSDTTESKIELHLHGEQMPEATYRSLGTNQPTLKDPYLLLDGTPVELNFNKRAFRNKARALKLTYQERSFEYTVTGVGKGGILCRPGVKINIARTKNPTGKGISSFGTVTGEPDAIDLALAIVFEEVDTFDLTSSGAAAAALNKIYNLPRANDGNCAD